MLAYFLPLKGLQSNTGSCFLCHFISYIDGIVQLLFEERHFIVLFSSTKATYVEYFLTILHNNSEQTEFFSNFRNLYQIYESVFLNKWSALLDRGRFNHVDFKTTTVMMLLTVVLSSQSSAVKSKPGVLMQRQITDFNHDLSQLKHLVLKMTEATQPR